MYYEKQNTMKKTIPFCGGSPSHTASLVGRADGIPRQPFAGTARNNVFDEPNADKLACMLRRENVCCEETNVFDKPNDQSQACLSFGVARKRGSEDTNEKYIIATYQNTNKQNPIAS